ncbi:MAG: hypothetical protein ACYDBS_03650, partial [Acidimicrobiales bacterium]
VGEASLALARRALPLLDLAAHEGVHPRLGTVDVVPFVPYGASMGDAIVERDRFARAFAAEGVPCFLYGPERSLPDVRRTAWQSLQPDLGPATPHPTAGATCVGARGVLVAYNIVIDAPVQRARELARLVRSPTVRALGLALGNESQVSLNLVDPDKTGPADVHDQVAAEATIVRSELVGLLPASILAKIPEHRWAGLGLAASCTIEARLEARTS